MQIKWNRRKKKSNIKDMKSMIGQGDRDYDNEKDKILAKIENLNKKKSLQNKPELLNFFSTFTPEREETDLELLE